SPNKTASPSATSSTPPWSPPWANASAAIRRIAATSSLHFEPLALPLQHSPFEVTEAQPLLAQLADERRRLVAAAAVEDAGHLQHVQLGEARFDLRLGEVLRAGQVGAVVDGRVANIDGHDLLH